MVPLPTLRALAPLLLSVPGVLGSGPSQLRKPIKAPAPVVVADASRPSPTEAVARLVSGNDAFSHGKAHHPHQDLERLQSVLAGQKPFATVLSCSDSRVPAELLFDQGIGDVFVVRVAGNVADTDELGTIEYGVDHLETPALVVLGHTKCGAVTAVATGAEVHGHIPELVDNIGPAVDAVKQRLPAAQAKELVDPAIRENVLHAMAEVIEKSPMVRARLKQGRVKIVGALYHLEDGHVEWLGEHPEEKALIARGDAAPPEAHGHGASVAEGEALAHADAHAKVATVGEQDPDAAGHGDEAHPASHASHSAPSPHMPVVFGLIAFIGTLLGAVTGRFWGRS